MKSSVYVLPLVVFACLLPAIAAGDDAEGLDFFEKKVRPVLVERCYECHSSQAKKLEGSFSLETRDGLLKGGDRGPALVPGDPEQSLIIQALRYQDKDFQMPPKEPLAAGVVADFEAWIKRGAPDPRDGAAVAYMIDIEAAKQRWPFTPIATPAVPLVKRTDWPRNPIDHFVLAKLEERGLSPVGDADKQTLIRRVTYDLIGLPPSPEEIEAFLRDDSPTALATVVDRLLDSPHYGERWGRHWLDVVRYADTAGDNSDFPIPQMVKYRNWVINAINADMPYDQFIRQQIAGDLLPADAPEQKHQQVIATSYLASARRFGSTVADYPTHLTIEDTIDNLGRSYLGLTINCARCHNHKFDPITTEDYYALYGIFHSTRYPWSGIELDKQQRDLVPLAPPEQVAAAEAERKNRLNALAAEVKAADEAKKAADKAEKTAREQLETLKSESAEAEAIAAAEKEVEAAKKTAAEAEEKLKAARKAKDELERSEPPYDTAFAVAEAAKIENARLQMKGDPKKLGPEVPRRIPQVFGGQLVATTSPESGRRELADWIASPENPLAARVMVNRLWHHHFGRGIVPTPNDFGKQGKPPSHPELLDFLATRLIESGWSLKAMHRLIVLSRTYQLSTADDPAALTVDPSNELLWRYSRRRLDAESIRDTLLVLGGNLDRSMGGPHPFPKQVEWDFTQHKPFKAVYDTNRRSVYLMTQRIQRHPFLAIFDGPDTGASTASRVTSTTTLQALYFLNDPFFHDQASRFAAHVRSARSSDRERLDLAYQMALGRPATVEEVALGEEYMTKLCEQPTAESGSSEEQQKLAWESLIRSLLRTNEFVYLN